MDSKLLWRMENLLSIRRLAVDFNIFGGAPINIWPAFKKLKVLYVVFYPASVIGGKLLLVLFESLLSLF